jgi:sterol desaturase/sphingolipid hydroxylase (fatty acid hydroxylase superfamily)
MSTTNKALTSWFVFWSAYILIGYLAFPHHRRVGAMNRKRPNESMDRIVLLSLAKNVGLTGCVALVLDAWNPQVDIVAATFRILFDEPYYLTQGPSSLYVHIVGCLLFLARLTTAILLAEIWFYYSHRLLHWPMLYHRFHAQHHEFTKPYALAALYCSGVEMVLCNQMASVLGPYLVGMNMLELCLWMMVAVGSSLGAHSGMNQDDEFPTMLQKVNAPHQLHHEYYNCNYGFLYLLDRLHRTFRVA